MTIDNSFSVQDEFPEARQTALVCLHCLTPDYLMIESIESLNPKIGGQVFVEYSCRRCEAFFAHDASVQDVAKLLTNTPVTAGVLKFGRYYIHCGEPMEKSRIQLSEVAVKGHVLASATSVRLSSAVLRCHCGFQMAIPE